MNVFDYLTVVTAIVIGLAITRLLSSAADLITQREHVRFYWVHAAWVVLLFLVLVQYWFNLFGWRRIDYSFISFLSSLIFPLCAFLASAVAAPTAPDGKVLNLETYYFAHRRWLFGFSAAGLAYLILHDWAFVDVQLDAVSHLIRASSVALLVVLAVSANRHVHVGLTVALLIAFCVFVALNPQ